MSRMVKRWMMMAAARAGGTDPTTAAHVHHLATKRNAAKSVQLSGCRAERLRLLLCWPTRSRHSALIPHHAKLSIDDTPSLSARTSARLPLLLVCLPACRAAMAVHRLRCTALAVCLLFVLLLSLSSVHSADDRVAARHTFQPPFQRVIPNWNAGAGRRHTASDCTQLATPLSSLHSPSLPLPAVPPSPCLCQAPS